MNTIKIDDVIISSSQREINTLQVSKISNKIKERGYNSSYPITIDKDNILVDGGHRIEAAKINGLIKLPFVLKPDNRMSNIQYRIWCNDCGSLSQGIIEPETMTQIDKYANVPVVYFVTGEGVNLVKIGITIALKGRLCQMQVGSPVLLKVVAVIRGGEELEAALHRRFSKQKRHGEWFEFNDKIKDIYTNHPDGEVFDNE